MIVILCINYIIGVFVTKNLHIGIISFQKAQVVALGAKLILESLSFSVRYNWNSFEYVGHSFPSFSIGFFLISLIMVVNYQ